MADFSGAPLEARQPAVASSVRRLARRRTLQEVPRPLRRPDSLDNSLSLEALVRQALSLAVRLQLQEVSSPSHGQEVVPSPAVPRTRRHPTQAADSLAASLSAAQEAAYLEVLLQEAVEVRSVPAPSKSLGSSDSLAALHHQLACSASLPCRQQAAASSAGRRRASQALGSLATLQAPQALEPVRRLAVYQQAPAPNQLRAGSSGKRNLQDQRRRSSAPVVAFWDMDLNRSPVACSVRQRPLLSLNSSSWVRRCPSSR